MNCAFVAVQKLHMCSILGPVRSGQQLKMQICILTVSGSGQAGLAQNPRSTGKFAACSLTINSASAKSDACVAFNEIMRITIGGASGQKMFRARH